MITYVLMDIPLWPSMRFCLLPTLLCQLMPLLTHSLCMVLPGRKPIFCGILSIMSWSSKTNPYFSVISCAIYHVCFDHGSSNFASLRVHSSSLDSPPMQSSVERHIDRRTGITKWRPRGRCSKEKTNRPKPTPTDLAQAKQK